MTRLPLLASWIDADTMDAMRDDNPYRNDSLEIAASPQGVLLFNYEQDTITAVLRDALEEFLSNYEGEDTAPPDGEWWTTGWQDRPSTGWQDFPEGFGRQEWFWGNEKELDVLLVVCVREAFGYGKQEGPQ